MPLVRKPPGATPKPQEKPFDPVALRSDNDEVRWTAVRAASLLPDGAALLGAALQREREPSVREAIFTGLARIGTVASVDVLLPYIRSDDASLRTGAIDALAAMPAAVLPQLPGLLADPDSDVRLLSCELVRNQPDAEANRLLATLLADEREVNVCAAALEVVAEVGGPEMLEVLKRCEERFSTEPFLAFSMRAVRERIEAQPRGRP
jgi:HEAT repeat protein